MGLLYSGRLKCLLDYCAKIYAFYSFYYIYSPLLMLIQVDSVPNATFLFKCVCINININTGGYAHEKSLSEMVVCLKKEKRFLT